MENGMELMVKLKLFFLFLIKNKNFERAQKKINKIGVDEKIIPIFLPIKLKKKLAPP